MSVYNHFEIKEELEYLKIKTTRLVSKVLLNNRCFISINTILTFGATNHCHERYCQVRS